MSTAEIAARPQERTQRRRPFANFVKRLANFKGGSESQERANNGKKLSGQKQRKHSGKSTVYPESGHLAVQPQASQPSFAAPSHSQYDDRQSYSSLPDTFHGNGRGNRSGAPTLATNPETVHSDAGQSKAATTTTAGGALSSMDGTRGGSTFSSPNQSEHSLATTLTTLQSTTLNHVPGAAQSHQVTHQSQPLGSMFSHQFPTSPAQTASAIPRHMTNDNIPTTYNSATAGNVLTDNASILTLASSSKRRRRSMDTDASVRALAPSSVWGGSRESLPLSVLSGNYGSHEPRTPGGGIPSASAERASVYSMSYRDSVGVTSPLLASERNSYYAKQATDAKSLRSITNIKDDARSQYDARSINNVDARSTHDVASLRSYAPSEARHARNDSIPGSVGASPVTATPSLLLRQASAGGTLLTLSRRSSDWRAVDEDEDEDELDEAAEVAGNSKESPTSGSHART